MLEVETPGEPAVSGSVDRHGLGLAPRERRREPVPRVGSVRVDRGKLVPGLILVGDVEPVGLAAAAHCDIQPLTCPARVSEDERALRREALSDVAGDGVAVDQRWIAVVRGLEQEPSIETDSSAPRFQYDATVAHGCHASALSVAHSLSVALHDDSIPDGEAATRKRDLIRSELASIAEDEPGARV